jgi:tetratricopeptide (TPR) repeat protein
MGKKNRKPTSPTTRTAAPVAVSPQPAVPAEPPQSLRHFFTPEDWIAAAVAFLIAGFAFLYYMSPEVTLEDSGELVTGAFNFGVPHPPGYPLWAFLGWVWRHFVPFGNPAYRICLMSVLTGALVVGVLTLLMTRSIMMLLRSVTWAQEVEDSMKHWIARTIGMTSALLFAFNRGVWLWACVPEMRVLNVFMFIITACTFFAWMMRPQRHGFLYVTILLYALGIANHQTIFVMIAPFMAGAAAVGVLSIWERRPVQAPVVMPALAAFWELLVAIIGFGWAAGAYVSAWLQAPPNGQIMEQKVSALILFGPPVPAAVLTYLPVAVGVLLLFWFGSEGWLSRKNALICTAAFLIGCSFYFYMSVASSTNPPMNWGYAYTKQGFLHAFTRGQYERLNIASPLSPAFFIQIRLFVSALIQQYATVLCLFALLTWALPLWELARERRWASFGGGMLFFGLVLLVSHWAGWLYLEVLSFGLGLVFLAVWPICLCRSMNQRARAWLIFVWAAFVTTSIGLLFIINPGLDKQNQEINIKFFAPAHGFFAMMIGYGMALGAAWVLSRWKQFPRVVMRASCVALLALPVIPLSRNLSICDQRDHDFGYQFGYRMFKPGGGYPDMDKDAVLYGGTDPGRFVPTYMIFCESRVEPKDRYRDVHFDPEGGPSFDRRDVYIITQNALADSTYMSYIRDHYDYSRPDPDNPKTLERRLPWQRALFRWGWHHLYRDSMYPKEPIWIPSEQDTQRAFQEYITNVQARQARGEQLSADEQVTVEGGAVQVRGVQGVMNINGILTKWIFDHARDKHAFYVEESYVIPWMYPYLTPFGIIMKINHDSLPSPEQDPQLWADIVKRDKPYWDKLTDDLKARRQFHGDPDAQKTFSKLRSAIGGVYAYRHMAAEAIYAFKQALELCPESPEGNFRLAQLYMELGRAEDALTTLQTLQKLDPLNAKITQAIQQISGVLQSRQDIPQLEAAHAGDPRNFGLMAQLGQAYAKVGQADRLDPLLQGYLKQSDISADDLMQVAQAYMNLNKPDGAVSALQLMTQRFPQDARAYYSIAMIRGMQDNAAEAIPMLEKALQLAPQFRAKVASEQAFGSLRGNPRFQQLMSSQ